MTQRAILVTGASTGIGFATTQLLADSGYVVYAGVRSAADAQNVSALHERVRAVHLDVTNAADIESVRQGIAAEGVPLVGIVNNAGIAVSGPLEYLDIAELRRQFEINTFAPIALTQAFLETMRETRGRIVFVGSIAGRMAAPFVGPYGASKAALASLVDSLRMELYGTGIAVSLLEFAAVKTPIWGKGRAANDAMLEKLPQAAHERYGDVVDKVVALTQKEEATGMEPSIIAEVVLRALEAPRPRERYLIGQRAKVQAIAAVLPPRTRDHLVRKAMGLP